MGNAVEEGPDVKINHPVLSPAALPGHRQRVVGTAPRTVAVTVGMEDRLQLLFQQHRCRGLGHPVRRIRHAEDPDPRPMIFRYLHRPHRPREIAPRRHPVPQPVEVVPLPRCELVDADSVHARRTLVRPDLLPRPIYQAFGDLKRLHLRLGSHPRLLPRRVGRRRVTLVCPAPSLRPHYKALTATTSRSAPVPRIGTLPLTVATAWGPPSRRPVGQASPITGRSLSDDRFSCSMPAPTTSSRHLYTGHRQGHTQAAPWPRAHPKSAPLSRGHPTRPGFDAIVLSFDASAVVHTRSSSRRTPDPLTAGLFPQRSPPRLLTDAACGGLSSPPARRTRRANPHHWHSTFRSAIFYIVITPLSGHTWGSRTRTRC